MLGDTPIRRKVDEKMKCEDCKNYEPTEKKFTWMDNAFTNHGYYFEDDGCGYWDIKSPKGITVASICKELLKEE